MSITEKDLLEARLFYILLSDSPFTFTPKDLKQVYTVEDLKKDYGSLWLDSFSEKIRELHKEAGELILNHDT